MHITVDELSPVRRRGQRQRRRRLPDPSDPLDRICELSLVIVVVASVLAIGTVHWQVLLCIAALASAGGVVGAMAFARLPAPAIVLGALGLFSALQAVPLPAAWVLKISPASAHIWQRSLAPFGEQDLAHFPLSLDAGASVAEALKWLT
jgi:hypothetical protein